MPRTLPLELQLLIFEHLCATKPPEIDTILHLLLASESLRRLVAQSHQYLLQPAALYQLGLSLDAFVCAILAAQAANLTTKSIKVDWVALLVAAKTHSFCRNCFSSEFGNLASVETVVTKKPDAYGRMCAELKGAQLDPIISWWRKTWSICPPCCYKPSKAVREPVSTTKIYSAKEPEQTTKYPQLDNINSTTQIVEQFVDKVIEQRKKVKLTKRNTAEIRKRWSGGQHISGWSMHDEEEGGPENDESDSEDSIDDCNFMECGKLVSGISAAFAVEPERASTVKGRNLMSELQLTPKCDGCSSRFCKRCVDNVECCPSCSAQLCIGCFPPASPLDTNVPVSLIIKSGSSQTSTELRNIRFPLPPAIGRTLSCSSCLSISCAGCGELEDWMLKVDGYGALGNRREQAFFCPDCRDCRNRNYHDYSSWFE